MVARIDKRKLIIALLLLGFGLTITRNAWLSDDAYITFRTVDNWINGYGLTWNPTERVQAYTHPLWMFCVSALYFFTRETYLTTLLLSIAISLFAVTLLAFRGTRSPFSAFLGITLLTLSKAFVDYATSGLENPLTHMILLAFLLCYLKATPGTRRLFFLSLLTALSMTNRMDTALLCLPALGYSLWQSPGRARERFTCAARTPTRQSLRREPLAPRCGCSAGGSVERWRRWGRKWGAVALGLLPFVLWELFALFYYGFPFPNTAYAKLSVGLINRAELLAQGVAYFANSWRWDPITLAVIGSSIVAPLLYKRYQLLPLSVGMLLYLGYVLRIGGDFMSGRFFAAPLLVAVTVLMQVDLKALKAGRWALVALVVGVGLRSPYSPVLTDGAHSAGSDARHITDEKGNYWSSTALILAGHRAHSPEHDWASEGRAARLYNPGVVEKGSIGFYGYFAGPEMHVVDLLALADPLLARLPPVDPNWSIGHLGRRSPEGYLETLASGENRIADPNLAHYYDKLAYVIRGDLFDLRRWREIWKLNTGAYDSYLDAYARFEGDTFVQRLLLTNPSANPNVVAYVWNNAGAEAYLLDDASQPGRVYSVTWTISLHGVGFQGDHIAHTASIGALDDATTLNIGFILSPTPDLTVYEIYEYRYWFHLRGDRLLIARQGMGWHNTQAPGGWWREADVGAVIKRQ